MLPLGDMWTGECRATGQSCRPDDATLHRLCNLGYARGDCHRFPGADSPDAVRFTISRDSVSTIQIYYVIERDHHPFAHGPLEYSPDLHGLTPGSTASAALARQAEAYASSYLRRKEL
jgi:hypothetical protein